MVGVCAPPSFSIVTAKPLAAMPEGRGGVSTVALPRAPGVSRPAAAEAVSPVLYWMVVFQVRLIRLWAYNECCGVEDCP